MLIRYASAKLNFGLHVLRKRQDGYHDLETVFYRIPWADVLTARPAKRITLASSGISAVADETNLVMKAARALALACDVDMGAALHLEKRLPMGGGLGGGSSDAAASLLLLADLWGLSVSPSKLDALALGLGSDVPFFLGAPTMYGTGRGEKLEPLDGYQLPYLFTVIVPRVHVSTAMAFGRIRPCATQRPDLRALVLSNDLARWRTELINDFEGPIFEQYPVLQQVKELLLRAGAGYASLTGTGAGVYGVFEKEADAWVAARLARREGHTVWSSVSHN